MNYQYWVTVKPLGSGTENEQMRFLNDADNDGWELVTVDPKGRYIFRQERTS